MRLLLSIALAFSLIAGGPCLAAVAKPPPAKLRPAQPVKPAPAAPQSRVKPLAGQLTPPLSFAGAPGLAALGLETMRLGAADAGPACRSTCAGARYICGVDDASCVSEWRQCVLSCGTSRP